VWAWLARKPQAARLLAKRKHWLGVLRVASQKGLGMDASFKHKSSSQQRAAFLPSLSLKAANQDKKNCYT
jgi:hypothetical protein